MKKIKLYLEYQCFPIWIYEDEHFLSNDIPKELVEDKELERKLVSLQEKYNDLFIDTDTSFKYIGFNSDIEKELFLDEFNQITKYLQEALGEEYAIENEIKF
ncbi:hypothetical protein [Enterococcus plantarum]|uniref:hypothetical protein n=1 Tax=Enterococcus plantarum TaxID=1077675 RepID=UPI001A8CDA7A|nr:hypothetical protein [Enterococcus plantarum]MBO0422446.1 hypothetical protein [Enterococcus plantarum]